jgi:hypothetical protein
MPSAAFLVNQQYHLLTKRDTELLQNKYHRIVLEMDKNHFSIQSFNSNCL